MADRGQPIANFRLRGWQAIVVVVLALLWIGYRSVAAHADLDEAGLAELRLRLAAEYGAAQLESLRAAVESGDRAAARRCAEAVATMDDITFPSASYKGRGDDIVLRVEVLVRGSSPPDGRTVRYFRAEHSLSTGWRIRRSASALSYYLRLF